jgi:winged helix DNA-binding protein
VSARATRGNADESKTPALPAKNWRRVVMLKHNAKISKCKNEFLRLDLSRSQILSFRRRAGSLDERLPPGPRSLRRAAWAGLQDSMPRAALLSIHARVAGASSAIWEHSSLVQLWGPRFSAYVVAAQDLPIFSLGRLPDDAARRNRAHHTASRLHAFLEGRRMSFGEAGHALRVNPNSLRYAAPTGTLVMRWDGARKPVVWTVPASGMDPRAARIELARRYLHIFGPATAASFAKWAGIRPREARAAFDSLLNALTPVRTPIGDAWILAEDVPEFRSKSGAPAPARLLPSGDTYYLFWGADRQLLLPDAKQRAALWTTRVWPGALLVAGEIAGVWRRSAAEVSIETWRRLSQSERQAVEAEAQSLPLPDLNSPVTVRWL